MTASKLKYNKDKLRLSKSGNYWWDIIFGGVLTFGIMVSSGTLILQKYNLSSWIFPYSIACILIIAYYQWRDDSLTVIQTGLSKTNNFQLVSTTLDNLNWNYNTTSTSIDLTLNKYLLKFVHPTILPESAVILINFKYHSTIKTGRLPFFFGISTYLEWTFKKAIKKTLLNTNSHHQIDSKRPR